MNIIISDFYLQVFVCVWEESLAAAGVRGEEARPVLPRTDIPYQTNRYVNM